ncbi:MAG TPA: ABC transporter substrate-binding protein, partial [Gemmata sp.]|nr:ABC transporter substrate-binding protein [Gemmata sp.]
MALLARTRLSRFAALGVFLLAAVVVGRAGQQPEVEDPKGGVKKRIVVDDYPDIGRKGSATGGNPPDVILDELTRGRDEARSPALKAVFARHAVPFDRIHFGDSVLRVDPVPLRKNEWPTDPMSAFVVKIQDDFGKWREDRRLTVGNVRGVDPFETIVQTQADALLKEKADGITVIAADNVAAAEKLLAAGLRFHDYARAQKGRRGKTWDDVRNPLVAKLRDVRLEMLQGAIAANDPLRIRDVSMMLMSAYPNDADVAREVAAARVKEAHRLLASANHIDHLRAKELIDEFENRFPGAAADSVKTIRQQLRELATKAFVRAKDKKAAGDLATARDELARASALDPNVEGIRDMQRELRFGYPILYVGVRQFPATTRGEPQNLSPATARTDSERQAVELLFEGLLEEVPNEDGSVRYRPGAAQDLPVALQGAREFRLRAYGKDPSSRAGFESHDVVGTVKLFGDRQDTWQAYPYPWLAGLPTPKDETAIRVPFALGHPDPRALLTFKLLPARYLIDNGLKMDDAAFAEKPFGTGPFRLLSTSPPGSDGPREMVFVDNANYGRWKDRIGLPHLREVRFIEVTRLDPITKAPQTILDPVEAFRSGRLHILTDIPTSDIEKFSGPGSGLAGRAQVVTAAINRRVHILAVNLTRPHLQSKALRQMISMAIDREKILDDVFRAGTKFHHAMTGPYPPNSWPAGKGEPLFQRDAAVNKLKAYLADAGAKLDIELAYPIDDPRAEEACRKIKAAVEDVSKDVPGERKLVVNLVQLPMQELLQRIQEEHNRFDLAYVPFDYPDDWYPYALGAALDSQAAGRGGRNWFHFQSPETNPDADDLRLGPLLLGLREYCDVSGALTAKAIEAGRLFNDCLPFIPLWQLDRHMVV